MMPVGEVKDYGGIADAHTLSRAHAIRKDGKRHGRAMEHLKSMADKSDHHADTHAHEEKHAGKQEK